MLLWSLLTVGILIVSLLLYVLTFKAFTSPLSRKVVPTDRFIRKIKEDDAVINVYCPNYKARRYVSRYLLEANRKLNVKLLKCKLTPGIRSIKYRVTVFDSAREQVTVILAEEETKRGEYTYAMVLPLETAFINLEVVAVDDAQLLEDSSDFRLVSLIGFWFVSGLILAVASVFFSLCIMQMVGGIFVEGYLYSSGFLGAMFALPGAAAILNAIISGVFILIVKKRRGQKR